MKKIIISILISSLLFSFFYAAIWTMKRVDVSDCLFMTGIFSLMQFIVTIIIFGALSKK